MFREGQNYQGPGQTIRIWLGFCEGSAEDSLEVSDEDVSVPFGLLPTGEALLPLVDSLAEIWQVQVAQAQATPLQTASEGPGPSGLDQRLASLEATVATLAASLSRPDTPVASGKSCSSQAGRRRRRQHRTFSRPRQGGCCSSAGGWRPSTGPAGNEPSRQRAGPMRKLKPEPEKARVAVRPDPLEESEDDARADAQPKPWAPPL